MARCTGVGGQPSGWTPSGACLEDSTDARFRPGSFIWKVQYLDSSLIGRTSSLSPQRSCHKRLSAKFRPHNFFFCKSFQDGFGGGFQTVACLLVRVGFQSMWRDESEVGLAGFHSSEASIRTAVTRRRTEFSLGERPITRVRRLIWRLRFSHILEVRRCWSVLVRQ